MFYGKPYTPNKIQGLIFSLFFPEPALLAKRRLAMEAAASDNEMAGCESQQRLSGASWSHEQNRAFTFLEKENYLFWIKPQLLHPCEHVHKPAGRM